MNRRPGNLRWNRVGCLCVSTAVLLAASAVGPAAAATELSTKPPSSLPAASLPIEQGKAQLSLEEAIEVALQRNLSLLVQRYEREQYRLGIEQSLGIYDYNLSADLRTEEDTTPAASNLDGADVITQKNTILNLGMSRLTPLGGTASLAFNNYARDSNSTYQILNPLVFIDLDLTYTQPLLRSFGRLSTERSLKVARLNSSLSRETFEGQVISTIQDVVGAYWNLIEARDQLEVARESLELAKELHEMNRVRVEVGTLAPLELVQSEAGVATRQEEIIRAGAAVADGEDVLRQLLNLEQGRLWELEIVPTTDPEMERLADIELEKAIGEALESRSELKSKQLELETLELDSAYYRGQKRPQVDLEMTYGLNGLGGDIQLRCDASAAAQGLCTAAQIGQVIETIPGGYGDAIGQLRDREYDGWSVGVTVAYPIQNRAARTASTIADLDLEQGRMEFAELEQAIVTEVRRAVRGVRTAGQQIDSARASRRLAEKNLEAEEKRYENGLSTSFQVLEIQEDLSQARSREITAVAGYRNAVVEYYRSLGSLLSQAGVELAD